MEIDPVDKYGNINWDAVKELYDQNKVFNDTKIIDNNKVLLNLTCKTCGNTFISKNYNGKYPLCIKHRNIIMSTKLD